jgi:hypothetical protein
VQRCNKVAGTDNPINHLKPYHVVEYVDAHDDWRDFYKRGAIVAVQRACNWAEEPGYIDNYPLKKIKKPPGHRLQRDVIRLPQIAGVVCSREGCRQVPPLQIRAPAHALALTTLVFD